MNRLARRLLRLIPPETVVPVMSGPLRRRRWIVGAAPHGAWIGTLERSLLAQFVAALRPDMIVWDIGANVGLYALAAAPRCRRVVAFEPLPRNLALLRRHLALNHIDNVDVVEAAVGRTAGRARLAEGDSPSEAKVTAQGTIDVHAISLDGWAAAAGAARPDIVKIDVEGAEYDVLTGGERSLAHRPPIHLAVHGDAVASRCLEWLQQRDYTVMAPGRATPIGAPEWICEAQ